MHLWVFLNMVFVFLFFGGIASSDWNFWTTGHLIKLGTANLFLWRATHMYVHIDNLESGFLIRGNVITGDHWTWKGRRIVSLNQGMGLSLGSGATPMPLTVALCYGIGDIWVPAPNKGILCADVLKPGDVKATPSLSALAWWAGDKENGCWKWFSKQWHFTVCFPVIGHLNSFILEKSFSYCCFISEKLIHSQWLKRLSYIEFIQRGLYSYVCSCTFYSLDLLSDFIGFLCIL